MSPASAGSSTQAEIWPGWATDPATLLSALRGCFTYPEGEGRATGWLFTDDEQLWPPSLAELGPRLLNDLLGHVGVAYTDVAFQGYRDGEAATSWHADSSFDAQALISLGATRSFGLKRPDGVDEHYIALTAGDLLVMPSGFQKVWLHCVPPDPHVTDERCSLVFRTRERPCIA